MQSDEKYCCRNLVEPKRLTRIEKRGASRKKASQFDVPWKTICEKREAVNSFLILKMPYIKPEKRGFKDFTPAPQMRTRHMRNRWIFIGALMGASVVALGAFGAHALKGRMDLYQESIYAKAVLYHMFHTGAIFVVGLISWWKPTVGVSFSGWAFVAGIFLFSGSLYIMAMTGTRWLGAVTPLGGLSFIAGWLWLARLFSRAD